MQWRVKRRKTFANSRITSVEACGGKHSIELDWPVLVPSSSFTIMFAAGRAGPRRGQAVCVVRQINTRDGKVRAEGLLGQTLVRANGYNVLLKIVIFGR